MSRKHHLFDLIKSLSQTEKAYFKRFSKLHTRQKDLKYLRLFDVIEKEKKYDEKSVKETLKNDIPPKNFPVTKNYLYNLILRSLESYYSGKDPAIEVRNLINQIQILYKKGLVDQAQKNLKRAKGHVEKYELFYIKGELIEIERELLITDASKKLDHAQNLAIIEEEQKNIEQIDNLFKCKKFERLLISEHWMNGNLSEGDDSIDKLHEEIGIYSEEEACSIFAKLHFNHASLLYHYIKKKDIHRAFYFARNNFKLVKDNPEILVRDEAKYIRILYIYLGLCLTDVMKKQAWFWEGFQVLESIKPSNSQIQKEVFDQKFNLAFNSALSFGQLDKGLEYIKEFEKELPQQIPNLSARSLIVYYYLVSYILFLTNNLNEAQNYANKVELLPQKDARKDIVAINKIHDILINFDLENWILLKSKIRNTLRWLKRMNFLSEPEQLLLSTLEKLRKKNNLNSKPIFIALLGELRKLETQKNIKFKFSEYFDLYSWIQAKIENRPFQDIYLENLVKPE